jgi:hypothetical protein
MKRWARIAREERLGERWRRANRYGGNDHGETLSGRFDFGLIANRSHGCCVNFWTTRQDLPRVNRDRRVIRRVAAGLFK